MNFLRRLTFPVYLLTAALAGTGYFMGPGAAILMSVIAGGYAVTRRKQLMVAADDYDDTPAYFDSARFARYEDLVTSKESLLLGEGQKKDVSRNLPQNFLAGYYTYPRRQKYVNNLVGFNGEGHVMTFANTGAGKGVSTVIPNLLNWGSSVVVMDIKGENFIRTCFQREKVLHNSIHLVDPYGVVKHRIDEILAVLYSARQSPGAFNTHSGERFSKQVYNRLVNKRKGDAGKPLTAEQQIDHAIAHFTEMRRKVLHYNTPDSYLKGLNPLANLIDLQSRGQEEYIESEARAIAELIVVRQPDAPDPHWDNRAVAWLALFIKFLVMSDWCRQNRSRYPIDLTSVVTLLNEFTQTEATLAQFRNYCREHRLLQKDIMVLASSDEAREDVKATIESHINELKDSLVEDSLKASGNATVPINDLKQTKRTIYLAIPADRLDSCQRIVRLWVGCITRSLFNMHHNGQNRVLLLLDEVGQLGRLEPLVKVLTLGRSYGINAWLVFQSLSQIKQFYPKDWEVMMGNLKLLHLFGVGPGDLTTRKYIEELCGQKTIEIQTESFSRSDSKSRSINNGYSFSTGHQGHSSSGRSGGSGSSWSTSNSYSMSNQYQARNLMTSSEAHRFTAERHLLYFYGKHPVDATPMQYHQMKMFQDRYPFQLPVALMEHLQL